MRRALTILVLVILAGAVAPARQPPQAPSSAPAQQPPVTFKVEVNYVELDAVVTDASGSFVRGLTKDDFEVVEEGVAQPVTAFTLVDVPIERPDPPLFKRAAIEPDVQSNHGGANGRVFVILLDTIQTDARRTHRVRAAARQFVERHLGANDLVAIVHTGGNVAGAQDFTTSRARLLAAIDRFTGRKIPSQTMARLDSYYAGQQEPRDSYDMERSAMARDTLATLKGVAEYLGGIRGRRKAIVWFGEGIDYNVDNDFQARDASVVREAMRDAIAAATRASVSFYGVDARGLGAGQDEIIDVSSLPDDPNLMLGSTSIQDEVRRAHNSLRTISEETGGFAIVNRTNMADAFSRIVQENSSYYVLGYYSSNDKRDGKFRKVDVRVKRPGLKVRARSGYTAAKGRAAAPSSMSTAASPEVRDALNSPLPVTGLPMTVFAAPFTGTAPKASVAVVVEFDPGRLAFVEKDGAFVQNLEVVAIAVDAKGRVQDGNRDEAPLRLSKRAYDAVTQVGLRLANRLDVPPGRYQVRVAARESNGTSVGVVVLDLDVPDFTKSPLAMSGIALTAPSASEMITPNPDAGFKDVLPSPPTARREFLRSDVLSLFVEVYDNQRTPHRVTVRTTVTADDGTVVFTASEERRSEELGGGKGGGYGHTARVPLKELRPGRYVLRVDAQTLMSNGATAAREVEFRIK